jgi:chloride channel 7
MFSFGEFFSLEGDTSNYSVWELNLFILIGCMGGLIGASFNRYNYSHDLSFSLYDLYLSF